MRPTVVVQDHANVTFDAGASPAARVKAGQRVRFETGDEAYAAIDGEDIDAGRVDFQRVNALAGPVFVDGAFPGHALGLRIESISLADRATALFVRRWRREYVDLARSRAVRVPIRRGAVELESGGSIMVAPMVGCIGVAPAGKAVSSLSPTGRTGGNMDLVELGTDTTVWFPVEVEGGLLSLGDLHARTGRGEPLGSGLECGGVVTGTILIASGVGIDCPVVCDARSVGFVGTSTEDRRDAEAAAVRAAWAWLGSAGVGESDALVICAALLHLENGGPAGNNVVASFTIADLARAGVDTGRWPISG